MEKQLIYQKISEVMAAVEAIGKDRENKIQNYNFRGIDDMYNALNKHLAKAKIFFASEVVKEMREERATQKGGNLIYSVMQIRWTVYAEDGSSITTETIGEAMDSGDKASNKAMSAAYKYALMQLFCIPTAEEKDTEAQSPEAGTVVKTFQLKGDNTAKKTCQSCGKEFSPKPGTERYAKQCLDCFKAKAPIKPVEQKPGPAFDAFMGDATNNISSG